MTIIAAFKGPDGLFIGGDSLAADSNASVYMEDQKVFGFNGFSFGYAGSFRFGQVLNHCFCPPPHDPRLDDQTYMVSVWVENLRETLQTYGVLKSESGVDEIGDGGLGLIIYRDQIYMLQGDLSIIRLATPYGAIGVGESFAVGAMYALMDSELGAKDILEKGLQAAVRHCPRCGDPITIIKHDPTTELKWITRRRKKTSLQLPLG